MSSIVNRAGVGALLSGGWHTVDKLQDGKQTNLLTSSSALHCGVSSFGNNGGQVSLVQRATALARRIRLATTAAISFSSPLLRSALTLPIPPSTHSSPHTVTIAVTV